MMLHVARLRFRWILHAALAMPGGLASAAEPAPSLQGVGDLPGGAVKSTVGAISGSGNFVAGFGSSEDAENEAFRWSAPGGISALGDLGNSVRSSGLAGLSTNGGIGAGFGTLSFGNIRAMRWTNTGGMSSLGTLGGSGFLSSEATGISGDGSRVVGLSTSPSGFRAFLWISGSGMQDLGTLRPDASERFSSAEAISRDGSTVVGWSNFTITEPAPDPDPFDDETPPPIIVDQGREAFVWTSDGGMTGLGDLAGGGLNSEALAVSADGSVIVGSGSTSAGGEGIVWSDGGILSVGDLDGGDTACQLFDVSADGRFAVGEGRDDSGRAAVIWDADNGLRKLVDVLAEGGIEFPGWKLRSAVAISDNGNVIAGNGFNPQGKAEGWVITDAGSLFDFVPPPVPPIIELQQSIRVFPGRGIKFTAEPGNIHQLQGRMSFDAEWQSFGEIFSSIDAPGPVEFILPIGLPEPGFTSFRVNRLPGSIDETPFVSGASLVEGVIIHFTAKPDTLYQMQSSPDLGSWTALGPVFDTTGYPANLDRAVLDPFEVSDGPPLPQRFYRIQRTR